MKIISGIAASNGIAIGPIFLYEEEDLSFERSRCSDSTKEMKRLNGALEKARGEIETIRDKAEAETGSDEAAIFEAHAMFLDDPALLEAVEKTIKEEQLNLESAWMDSIEMYASQMEAMEDEYFKARAADIRDVGNRILRILLGKQETDLSSMTSNAVVVARDLTPSDTVRMNKKLVLGFSTVEGGPTSHTAILAKALGLPAVVGAGSELLKHADTKKIIIDGSTGVIILDPDKKQVKEYQEKQGKEEKRSKIALEHAHEPARTRDGHTVEIVANAGGPEDAASALEHGAEGIGLLRTEFLYLDSKTAPDEETQLAAYTAVLDVMGKRPVVVRTIDVGGDKEIPYINLGREANPFLGFRAIRMCLQDPEFFKTQLRALVRASFGHDLRIMFPMIATIEEVRQAKVLLEEAKREVYKANHSIARTIQVGIMVEIPSVAILADLFAREVDFFSIGTNDLTQYTLAAERTNDRVAYLGDACHPAVLREIARVIEEAHKQKIWTGVCGELAGDPDAVPILLGLGLDEFSMAPSLIPRAKEIIREWKLKDARKAAAAVLNLHTAREVREFIHSQKP
ncbi:MAG: phosphoenolpyruvate--protein phosphotransferase [Anaerolineales bacterium]|nr:phosphoenolpyruvate--protein phosphotransferase [Anaerolineales bacterium]